MSVPRFYLPGLDPTARTADLPAAEAHHLVHVLRLGVGAEIGVFDGRGHEWLARVAASSRHAVTIDLGSSVVPVAEPAVRVTLAAGLLKGDQMDAVVRDATMLGVQAIVPMTTAHVVVPERAWKDRRAIERWQRVAVASAKQCGRAVVPVIHSVTPFARVISADEALGPGGLGAPAEQVEPASNLIFVEPGVGGAGSIPPRPRTAGIATLLLGPEGGWSREEVDRAAGAGFALVHLGPRTLRAERAPLVALSALWAVWGW